MHIIVKKEKYLGHGVYKNTETGQYRCPEIEHKKGFKHVGNIDPKRYEK